MKQRLLQQKCNAEVAIKAKLMAETEGLEKKTEALAKLNDTGKMEMQIQVAKVYIEQLPAII